MPPRGVKPGSKRARQYEHIKESEKDQGASEDRAEEIAARTVNKERARSASRAPAPGPRPVTCPPHAAAAAAPGPTGRRDARATSCMKRRASSASTAARR